MIITVAKLRELKVCSDSKTDFTRNLPPETELSVVIERLIAENRFGWADTLLIKLMTDIQKRLYEIHAAELVLPIFEDKYPSDARPREAIAAGKAGLLNREAYYAAVEAAKAAGDPASRQAAYAAAYTAANRPASSANSAYVAGISAGKPEIGLQILRYGLQLLGEV